MNPNDLLSRLQSRIAIRQAHKSITENKTKMQQNEINGYKGFTDPEEKKILANGGHFGDVEKLRKSKAESKAPELLKEMQAGKNPKMSAYEKEAVLALAVKSRSSAPKSGTASVPASSAAAEPERSTADVPDPVPSSRQDFSNLSGLELSTAVHRAETASKPAPPTPSITPGMKSLTGLDRATAYHQATAPNPAPKPSGKASTPRPDVSNLKGLAKAQAIAKWEADNR